MNQNVLGYTMQAVVPAVLATGLCVSLCTIQQPDGVLIDAGQPSGNFVNCEGLVDMPCMSAPMSEARIQASEQKGLEDIQTFAPRHVWIAAWCPQLDDIGTTDGWQAVIDGVAFDLLGAESDSQSKSTRIAIRNSGL